MNKRIYTKFNYNQIPYISEFLQFKMNHNPTSTVRSISEEQQPCQNSQKQYLAVPEIFSYEYFQSHRYQISQKDSYQCMCNNGFIKIFTLKTRVYWHAQNQFLHRVPDWKFHVSVHHQDLKKAWNLIVGVFLKMKCRAGMKTIYLKQLSDSQKGREITVYIVKYSKQFENSAFAGEYQISIADQHSEDYWFQFAAEVQRVFEVYEIRSNGLAQGDLKIGKYVSLRNQAFVLAQDGNYKYPANSYGWNHLNQKLPFNISSICKYISEYLQENNENMGKKQLLTKKSKNKLLYFVVLPIAIVSFGLIWGKQIKRIP